MSLNRTAKGIVLVPSLLLGGAFMAAGVWADGPAAANRTLALVLGGVLMAAGLSIGIVMLILSLSGTLDAIARLAVVLDGGEDPGEPALAVNPVPTARVPSREQTLSSNATTWVIVLLVVGTIVPMLTWWVFSR